MTQDHVRTRDLLERLVAHPLYAALRGPAELRVFMEYHVYCVWDFQSLLKGLQRRLTCVEVPWLPTPDPAARRLVNELVLGEESDEDGRGGHRSHFELYCEAMRDAGADTTRVERFTTLLADGLPLGDALSAADTPRAAARFVRHTLGLAASERVHELCAAFALGREEIIPDIFRRLVDVLARQSPAAFGRFRYYLDRHVAVDGEAHGPQSQRLLRRLCGDDPRLWSEAEQAARAHLEERGALWDAILAALPRSEPAAAGLPAAGKT